MTGYLTLTQFTGDRVRIETPSGEVVWVMLGETLRKGKAKLHIMADRNVRIHREEVWRALEADRATKEAAK